MSPAHLRTHARAIWDAAVAVVRPQPLMAAAVSVSGSPLAIALARAENIWVVGGGKAGGGMSEAFEFAVEDRIDRVRGCVNVPAESVRPLQAITLNAARPQGSNEPTDAGVAATEQMLGIAASAGKNDIVVCLLSGGGSALLPAPADGITLADKVTVTRLLTASGATIDEMNCVRKHLSRFKGGGLVRACKQAKLFCLILSDVVGDPLDVIASGPTVADPTTYADAINVLRRHDLMSRIPKSIHDRLEAGVRDEIPETLKLMPESVTNQILGNNATALIAAERMAENLGYRVLNLGSFVEGETRHVAAVAAGVIRSIMVDGKPFRPPACLLIGGETTVNLGPHPGRGGRNTEFVLAALQALEMIKSGEYVAMSGGTDGEDGPTDAAGAIGDRTTLPVARTLGFDTDNSLRRHDSYSLFDANGDLLRTGLTGTNVMDVRVLLCSME